MAESSKSIPDRIVEILALWVRVITDRQAAVELYWDAARPIRVARTAIDRLKRRGLVETLTAMVHPEPMLEGPILDWRPEGPLPNFDRIAWKLQSRWTEPLVRTTVAWATTKAKQLHGALGRGRGPRAKEIAHDIGVSQTYFHLCRHHPELAQHWIGEDELRAKGRTDDIPDAILALPKGQHISIDFGGTYSARKLRTIHQNYAPQGRYQLW